MVINRMKLQESPIKGINIILASIRQVFHRKNAPLLQDLTHLSLVSLLWDIGKQNSLRCNAAERGVPSGAILFAKRIFIKNFFEH